MKKAKRDARDIPIRIYRPSFGTILWEWTRVWVIVVMFIAACALPVYLNAENYSKLVTGDYTQYYIIILASVAFFNYLAYRSHYIAIYEDGIMLSSPLKKKFSSWDNLNSLELGRYLQHKRAFFVLVTKEDIDEQVKGKQNEISLERYTGFELPPAIIEVDYKSLVPEGQLGEDLQRFAPHLFE